MNILFIMISTAIAAPNLVLVSVDGMRADRAGFAGAEPSPSPTLDRLAAQGLVCDAAFSQSNESLFSHAALLTGRHVSELGRPDYRRFTVPDAAVLLPEVLALYGYTTAAFVAGGHVKADYGFNQGFSVYDDAPDFGAFFHTVPTALDWIDNTALQPFFVFLHGYDTHRPYHHAGLFHHVFGAGYTGVADEMTDRSDVERILDGVFYPSFPLDHFWHQAVGETILDPAGYARIEAWAVTHPGTPLTEADRQHLRDHYDSGVLSADLQLGLFVEALKARGLWSNTLVLITADHGEDLGDHGLYNHRSTLADSATRVPLIIAGGALPKTLMGTHIPGLCSALDVVPTLLGAADATVPAGLTGVDLLSGAPGHEVLIQEGVLPMIAVRTATHRLVVEGLPLDSPLLPLMIQAAPVEDPTFQLYDLRSDPTEQHSVLDEQRDTALALRTTLLAWLAAREASDHLGTQPLDPAFQEVLRSRGYW